MESRIENMPLCILSSSVLLCVVVVVVVVVVLSLSSSLIFHYYIAIRFVYLYLCSSKRNKNQHFTLSNLNNCDTCFVSLERFKFCEVVSVRWLSLCK